VVSVLTREYPRFEVAQVLAIEAEERVAVCEDVGDPDGIAHQAQTGRVSEFSRATALAAYDRDDTPLSVEDANGLRLVLEYYDTVAVRGNVECPDRRERVDFAIQAANPKLDNGRIQRNHACLAEI
jgi:hypothetical protein